MKIQAFEDNGLVTFDSNGGEKCWFVMHSPANKATRTKDFLDLNSIECIVPMHYQDIIRRGKTMRELVIGCDGFVFINTTKTELRWIKQQLPYLTYVKCCNGYDNKFEKMIVYVNNDQKRLFRKVSENYLEDIMVLDSSVVEFEENGYVVPTAGILKNEPLFVVSVEGISHRCLATRLNEDIVIVIKSLSPELILMQNNQIA